METQLRNWFDALMAHAKKNYSKGGWDMFVECVDFNEFTDEYNAKQFDSYDSAMAFYKADLNMRDEIREDIQREAF